MSTIPPTLSALRFEPAGLFARLTVTPEQFYPPPSIKRELVQLCVSLLDDVRLEIAFFASARAPMLKTREGSRRKARQFLKTLAWIDGEPAPIAFDVACVVAGLDPDQTRSTFRAAVRAAWESDSPLLQQVAALTKQCHLLTTEDEDDQRAATADFFNQLPTLAQEARLR